MEVVRTSMIHAIAPNFLWPFAVRYAAHQLNLWPRVSLPEKVGDASRFRVWGARAFVPDTTADKLSARAVPCVFLGFVHDVPSWQFYHPTSRRVLPSQDVTFDESVPFYHLFPYRTAPLPPPRPSSSLQVLPRSVVTQVLLWVVLLGVLLLGVLSLRVRSLGVLSLGVLLLGVLSLRVLSLGVLRRLVSSLPGAAVSVVAPLVPHRCTLVLASLSPHNSCVSGTLAVRVALLELGALLWEALELVTLLLELFLLEVLELQRVLEPEVLELLRVLALRVLNLLLSGLLGVAAFVRVCLSPHSSCTTSTVAVRVALLELGALPLEVLLLTLLELGVVLVPEVLVLEVHELLGLEVLSLRVLLLETMGLGVLLLETLRLEILGLEVPVLGVLLLVELVLEELALRVRELLGVLELLVLVALHSRACSLLHRGFTERREPASHPVSPVRSGRSGRPVPRSRAPAVPSTHLVVRRPSSPPQRVPLPSPPASSLPTVPEPQSDRTLAAHPTVMRLLAIVVTDPSFESAVASALVAELVDFAAACHLDYTASLIDRHEDLDCLAAAAPHLVSMLLAHEGDPDAPDIPTPHSYAEAIAGTYVDEVPPPRANIVCGMWIFRVKRPPGSPPVFKARYVARDFSQREGDDFFQTFSPTTKMTTLWVLLHVAAQRDYELHSFDFSTPFLQGTLHEEIWLRRPPSFTGAFPLGT
ncbi:unnamed protein product [Closterium sp. NIES-64]|nr:unnamed protein product [Closterium sp. NIES-64]